MSRLFAAWYLHPNGNAGEDAPHIFGYQVARIGARSPLLQVQNGPAAGDRVAWVERTGRGLFMGGMMLGTDFDGGAAAGDMVIKTDNWLRGGTASVTFPVIRPLTTGHVQLLDLERALLVGHSTHAGTAGGAIALAHGKYYSGLNAAGTSSVQVIGVNASNEAHVPGALAVGGTIRARTTAGSAVFALSTADGAYIEGGAGALIPICPAPFTGVVHITRTNIGGSALYGASDMDAKVGLALQLGPTAWSAAAGNPNTANLVWDAGWLKLQNSTGGYFAGRAMLLRGH